MSHCIVRFCGTHIQHGCLKAGIAVFPAEGDQAYARHYVPRPIIPEGGIPQGLEGNELRAWLSSLPTRMELNPVFTHFIRISPDTTLPQLETEVQRILTPDVLVSADAFLSDRTKTERRGFSQFRKMMAVPERLGSGLVLPKGYDARTLIAEANQKFKGLFGELDGQGKIVPIKPGTIDVGTAAVARASEGMFPSTRILKENPANATGSITSVEIFAVSGYDLTDCEVAAFEEVGTNTFTTRDSEAVGSVTGGSKQVFSGLDMEVGSGDYIGITASGGRLELDTSGEGVWWHSGDQIPCTDLTFSSYSGYTASLYGEGEEAATEKESSDTGSGLEASNVESEGPPQDLSADEPGEGADRLVAKIEMPTKGGGMKLWT
jgi:hypothetical protein